LKIPKFSVSLLEEYNLTLVFNKSVFNLSVFNLSVFNLSVFNLSVFIIDFGCVP